jgi:hypothetical protein
MPDYLGDFDGHDPIAPSIQFRYSSSASDPHSGHLMRCKLMQSLDIESSSKLSELLLGEVR